MTHKMIHKKLSIIFLSGIFILFLISCKEDETTFVETIQGLWQEITADSLSVHIEYLADDELNGRNNGTEGSVLAQEYIIDKLIEYGIEELPSLTGYKQVFSDYHAIKDTGVSEGSESGTNIIGYIPGTDPVLSEQVVLIGAHYDHLGTLSDYGCHTHEDAREGDTICNGASDNGSGVAILLETARLIMKSGLDTPRTIVLTFWDAEEDGLCGSNYYAITDPVFSLESTIAYINVDMLGLKLFAGMENGFFACGIDTAEEWLELLDIYGSETDLQADIIPVSFNLSLGASDHSNFSFHTIAEGLTPIPSIFFTSSAANGYHTVIDELSFVIMDQVALGGRLTFALAADISRNDYDFSFTGSYEDMQNLPVPLECDVPGILRLMEIYLAHTEENEATPQDIDTVIKHKAEFENMVSSGEINMGYVIGALLELLPLIGLDIF